MISTYFLSFVVGEVVKDQPLLWKDCVLPREN